MFFTIAIGMMTVSVAEGEHTRFDLRTSRSFRPEIGDQNGNEEEVLQIVSASVGLVDISQFCS